MENDFNNGYFTDFDWQGETEGEFGEIFKQASVDRFRKRDLWIRKKSHYFQIADITVCVENSGDFESVKFKNELMAFSVDGPGDDNVTFRHYFGLPDLTGVDLGKEIYNKAPWVIYQKSNSWIYKGIMSMAGDNKLHQFVVFNADYTRADIYNPEHVKESVRTDGFNSLSLFPTDQIWLAPLLADRQAVLLHSAAAIINGKGLIFVGHSDAGKTTTMKLLKTASLEQGLDVEILCDDRNIIRHRHDDWCAHGTWSHGDISDVSPASAPIKGILFLEQAKTNEIIPQKDKKQLWSLMLATLIRPLTTAQWWQKEIDILEQIIAEVPCYRMCFDRSGEIILELEQLTR